VALAHSIPDQKNAVITTMRYYDTSNDHKKWEPCFRFIFVACILSATTASGVFILWVANTPRQLLPELSTSTTAPTSEIPAWAIKLELVSFRSLQPDGSLEIKHIDVETAVVNGGRDAQTVAMIRPHHNLRLARLLTADDARDDDGDDGLAFYRNVRVTSSEAAFARRSLSLLLPTDASIF
jgi:hypothetical protein